MASMGRGLAYARFSVLMAGQSEAARHISPGAQYPSEGTVCGPKSVHDCLRGLPSGPHCSQTPRLPFEASADP